MEYEGFCCQKGGGRPRQSYSSAGGFAKENNTGMDVCSLLGEVFFPPFGVLFDGRSKYAQSFGLGKRQSEQCFQLFEIISQRKLSALRRPHHRRCDRTLS